MNVFSALSDPTRRAILDLLTKRPLTVGEIGSHFSLLSQPGISKHLGILRKTRLVKSNIKAQKRVYSLNREGFEELQEWISKYDKFWSERLDSLGEYLRGGSESAPDGASK